MSDLPARVRSGLGSVIDVVVETYTSWRDDRTIRLGAGLAYYGLFAIVPLLAFTVAVVGWVFSQQEAQALIFERLQGILPFDMEELSRAVAEEVNSTDTISASSTIGTVSLIVTASLVFVALQDAFNVIWEAPYRAGIANSLRRRLMAFGVVLLTVGISIASVILQSIAGLAEKVIPGQMEILESLAGLMTFGASLVAWIALLTLVYRVLTYADVPWGPAAVGATASALAVAAAVSLFGIYVERFGTATLTGATGVAFIGLVLIYAVSQIVLAGCQLAKVLTRRGIFTAQPGASPSVSPGRSPSPDSS